MHTLLALFLVLVLPASACRALDPAVAAVASLTDPQKLATLKGDRAANDRLLKCVYWLHDARARGHAPETVVDAAQKLTGDPANHAALVREGLLRNLLIADRLGLLGEESAQGMRRGRSPIVTRGPYAGEKAEVDHILPVVRAPELRNELANLELMPRTLNRRKGAAMGQRQLDYARRFRAAAMLSEATARTLGCSSAAKTIRARAALFRKPPPVQISFKNKTIPPQPLFSHWFAISTAPAWKCGTRADILKERLPQ